MGNTESSATSPCEGTGDAAEENEEVIIEIEPKLLFCTSISLSAEEMQCLNLEENRVDKDPTIEINEEGNLIAEDVIDHNKTTLETIGEDDELEFFEEGHRDKILGDGTGKQAETERSPSSKFGFFHTVLTNADGKTHAQLYGFFRKLKKGPVGMSLHTFHPTIPSLNSIRIFSKKTRKPMLPSSQMDVDLVPLPSQIDVNLVPQTSQLDVNLVPHFLGTSWKNFSLPELQKATDNFSSENVIGTGGYSEVFKGHLEDGELVAVKKLTRGSPEEMTSDYLSELGILVHVSHPNIASVIGYGVEGGMFLVLPLSPHGSLATLLNGDQKGKLAWGRRYKITLGTAKGLAYLHEECQRRIIHRDIKAANVLLTQDFEAQISDFGLAKWLPDKWSHLTVSQFEGTFGYLPPEFFMHGIVDEKTDVYAFGVLLLEIITGRPALDEANNSVVMWAKPLLLKKSYSELADPALGGDFDYEQMNRMAMVASLCLQQSATDRPSMGKVERMLKGEETISTDNKKFQTRPTLRAFQLELLDDDSLFDSPADSPKSSSDTPKSSNASTPKSVIDPNEIIHEVTWETEQ
ncbi:PREDICTED: receptor-like cytosolic serine/threonine-protein kinase RBK2 isoform X2 [Ipomoea nil]|uniref:receptor-like cytosolic serine/threonine-protein kinase RBK2 isoform X2 n=1 Tax=Ipomoea nil TaxID=35883 RepID=UPI000901ABA4|nr:PREDICTED: receptor-like cytosolic serine/threonine-protein kinase RBK2 isoform X2 [Ipomoea nil]